MRILAISISFFDAEGHDLSHPDSRDLRKKFGNDDESEEESIDLSHYDAECQKQVVAPAVGFEPTTSLLMANKLRMMGHT